MKKQCEDMIQRTKKVLYSDKLVSPTMFKQTLKLEFYNLLRQFMEVSLEDISLSILVEPTGKYKVTVCAQTNKIKPIGQMNIANN